MKMTKAIREFIEEQVSERLETATAERKQELKERADLARSNWKNMLDNAQLAFEAQLLEMANSIGYEYIGYGGARSNPGVSFHCTDYRGLAAVKEYDEYCRSIQVKQTKAIKDIIVSMELGGTKKELMEMISKLEF